VHNRWNSHYNEEEYLYYEEITETWLPYDPIQAEKDHLNIYEAIADLLIMSGHSALDLVGLVPGLGEIADGINAAWYYLEGDIVNGALSTAAMVPFMGAVPTAAKWTKNALKLQKVGIGDLWISPKGLKYPPLSSGQDRLAHVYEHVQNNLAKDIHGIFDDPNDVVGVIDEAWEKVLQGSSDVITSPGPGGNINYVVNLHRNVGIQGGDLGHGGPLQRVLISIKAGTTDEVVTAYPY
jgi:hypothetical protein